MTLYRVIKEVIVEVDEAEADHAHAKALGLAEKLWANAGTTEGHNALAKAKSSAVIEYAGES